MVLILRALFRHKIGQQTSMYACRLVFLPTTLDHDGETLRHILRSWLEPCPSTFDGAKRLLAAKNWGLQLGW
jgi:hypothetical protein